jgi:hypothetical protein
MIVYAPITDPLESCFKTQIWSSFSYLVGDIGLFDFGLTLSQLFASIEYAKYAKEKFGSIDGVLVLDDACIYLRAFVRIFASCNGASTVTFGFGRDHSRDCIIDV